MTPKQTFRRIPYGHIHSFRDHSMTYIAAFHCQGGLVMCADTQETVGRYKSYVEKITIDEERIYPIAVGGLVLVI